MRQTFMTNLTDCYIGCDVCTKNLAWSFVLNFYGFNENEDELMDLYGELAAKCARKFEVSFLCLHTATFLGNRPSRRVDTSFAVFFLPC
jgi:hypothetical protein